MALQKGTVRQMLEINEEAAGRVVEFFKTAREQTTESEGSNANLTKSGGSSGDRAGAF